MLHERYSDTHHPEDTAKRHRADKREGNCPKRAAFELRGPKPDRHHC